MNKDAFVVTRRQKANGESGVTVLTVRTPFLPCSSEASIATGLVNSYSCLILNQNISLSPLMVKILAINKQNLSTISFRVSVA